MKNKVLLLFVLLLTLFALSSVVFAEKEKVVLLAIDFCDQDYSSCNAEPTETDINSADYNVQLCNKWYYHDGIEYLDRDGSVIMGNNYSQLLDLNGGWGVCATTGDYRQAPHPDSCHCGSGKCKDTTYRNQQLSGCLFNEEVPSVKLQEGDRLIFVSEPDQGRDEEMKVMRGESEHTFNNNNNNVYSVTSATSLKPVCVAPFTCLILEKKVETTVDNDEDGYSPSDDCDDNDAKINPDADEVCDGVDNDCDGGVDEGGVCDADSNEDVCEDLGGDWNGNVEDNSCCGNGVGDCSYTFDEEYLCAKTDGEWKWHFDSDEKGEIVDLDCDLFQVQALSDGSKWIQCPNADFVEKKVNFCEENNCHVFWVLESYNSSFYNKGSYDEVNISLEEDVNHWRSVAWGYFYADDLNEKNVIPLKKHEQGWDHFEESGWPYHWIKSNNDKYRLRLDTGYYSGQDTKFELCFNDNNGACENETVVDLSSNGKNIKGFVRRKSGFRDYPRFSGFTSGISDSFSVTPKSVTNNDGETHQYLCYAEGWSEITDKQVEPISFKWRINYTGVRAKDSKKWLLTTGPRARPTSIDLPNVIDDAGLNTYYEASFLAYSEEEVSKQINVSSFGNDTNVIYTTRGSWGGSAVWGPDYVKETDYSTMIERFEFDSGWTGGYIGGWNLYDDKVLLNYSGDQIFNGEIIPFSYSDCGVLSEARGQVHLDYVTENLNRLTEWQSAELYPGQELLLEDLLFDLESCLDKGVTYDFETNDSRVEVFVRDNQVVAEFVGSVEVGSSNFSIAECSAQSEDSFSSGGGEQRSLGEIVYFNNKKYFCSVSDEWDTGDLPEQECTAQLGNDRFVSGLCCGDDWLFDTYPLSFDGYSSGQCCVAGELVSAGRVGVHNFSWAVYAFQQGKAETYLGLVPDSVDLHLISFNEGPFETSPPATTYLYKIRIYVPELESGGTTRVFALEHPGREVEVFLDNGEVITTNDNYQLVFSSIGWHNLTIKLVGGVGQSVLKLHNPNNKGNSLSNILGPDIYFVADSPNDYGGLLCSQGGLHLCNGNGENNPQAVTADFNYFFNAEKSLTGHDFCDVLRISSSSDGSTGFYCSPQREWLIGAGFNTTVYSPGGSLGCCPPGWCWNGTGCVESFGPDDIFVYDGTNYSCVGGDWVSVGAKLDWFDDELGFCNASQCFVSATAAGDENLGVDDDFCLDSGGFVGDHLCEGGVWTSRTLQIAQTLLSLPNDDYVLFCDSPFNSLNEVDYLGTISVDTSHLSEVLFGDVFGPGFVNNFCVLKYVDNGQEEVVFGAGLNQSINTSVSGFHPLQYFGHSLGLPTRLLGGQLCSNVISTNNDKFSKCNGQNVFYNPVLMSFIYQPSSKSLNSGNSLFETLISSFCSLFDFCSNNKIDLVQAGNSIGFDSDFRSLNTLNRLYQAQKGGKKVVAVLEQLSSGLSFRLLVAEYGGFDFDKDKFCALLEDKGLSCQVDNNNIFVAELSSSNVDDVWKELTAQLRLQ